MNKLLIRIISVLTTVTLIFGSYSTAQASSITSPSAAALSYYVSTTGSDSNPGTLTAPFKTIDKAVNTAQAGDLIYVRAGTYSAFTISKSGITISGYNGEMPLISGGNGIRCSAGSTNVTIKGFEVTGASGNYIGAIMLNNCSNSTVTGNKVHDNTSSTVSGIIVYGNNNKILNNEVYNNNFSGIRVFGVSQNNEIAFNKSYNHTLSAGNSDGIDLADPTVSGTNIHDNLVFGNSDDGIDTWTSSGNTVKNNVSHDNGGTGDGNGFKLGGNITGGNNTVIGNTSFSNKASGFTSNGGGDYYESNTAYNNAEYGFVDSWRNAGNTQTSSFIKNLAYSNTGGNFRMSPTYSTTFLGNSETPSTSTSASPTVAATFTSTPLSPTSTATPIASSTISATSTSVVSATLTKVATLTKTALPTATTFTKTATVAPTKTLLAPTATPTTVVASPTNTVVPTNIVPPTLTLQPTLQPVNVSTGTSTDIRISKGSDDVEESSSGQMYLDSNDLELVYDDNAQVVGLRFTGVKIPQGAIITNAYIQFKTSEATSKKLKLIIKGEANANPAEFNSTNGNVSKRLKTSSSVSWFPSAWRKAGEMGKSQRTPNLKAIVQEIVNQPTWTPGNSMVMIILGSNGKRVAFSFEGDVNGAPLLHVEFSIPAQINTMAPTLTSTAMATITSTATVASPVATFTSIPTQIPASPTTAATEPPIVPSDTPIPPTPIVEVPPTETPIP